MREIKVQESNSNQRLDKFLLKYLNTAPKSFVYKMLRKKNIKLNDKKANGDEILKGNDKVTLYLADETIDKFREIVKIDTNVNTVDVVYEDDNILIINKPIGVLTQPAKEDDTDTIVHRVTAYLMENGDYDPNTSQGFKPSTCNRLDLNTSGLIICGKNLLATQRVNELMRNKQIEKYYTAIVYGVADRDRVVKGFHYKNFATNEVTISKKRRSSVEKEVETRIYPLDDNGEYSIINVELITGKSHQIRASLSSINMPLIGDRKYGDPVVNDYFKRKYGIHNQLLTANKMVLHDNDGLLSYLDGKVFEADLHKKFRQVKNELFR